MTKSQLITQQLTDMAILFNYSVNERQLELYCQHLQNYDEAMIVNAFQQYSRTGRFFPAIADLINLMEPDVEGRAEIAWEDVKLSLGGNYALEPDEEYALERIGGRKRLAMANREQLDWKYKKAFLAAYKSAVTQTQTEGIEFKPRSGVMQIGSNL